MKKIIILASLIGVLFINVNKTDASIMFSFACSVGNYCPTQIYSCGGNTYKDYNSYKQCTQREEERKNILESQAKQKLYEERKEAISLYSDFFEKVGINLTLDTDIEQYEEWLKELKEAKINYIKEEENQQKIKELEDRLSELESQKTTLEIVETNKTEKEIDASIKNEVINPKVINSKIIKPIVKNDEIREIPKEESIAVIEPTASVKPQEKVSWFKKIINWFIRK